MRLSFLPLLLVLVAAGCGNGDAPAGTEGTPVGSGANATGQPLEIVPVTAEGLRQEVRTMGADAVVLNVWATWCGPCRSEFPEFVRYGRDAAERNVAVRFLSVDEEDDYGRVQQFLEQNGASGRTYLTAEGTEIVGDLARPNRWTYGIPVTIIFGPDGEVRDFWEGAVNYDFLQVKVQQVLGAASPSAG